jgi:L-alanine-DL-glutamate epimerase-like enolase superfamily enzyme
MKLAIEVDSWPLRRPFVIAGSEYREIRSVTAVIADGGRRGRGEAIGVDYLGETPESIATAIEGVKTEIEAGIERGDLRGLLPAGGARNAIDGALLDLEAKKAGRRAWELLGVDVQPVQTVFTLSLADAVTMAAEALERECYPVLKVKLDQHDTADKIRAIRAARPDADIVIDANGSWSISLLDALADVLLENRISMVEQPLPRDQDHVLEGNLFPITLCADESCHSTADIEYAAQCYSMINIKLDKCGGLTEAMRMVDWCRQNGLQAMIGNMIGSSLAMAPAFVPAQFCRYVDLDGPLLQARDREHAIDYRNRLMAAPEPGHWG